MTINFVVNADLLNEANLFASTEKTRFYLNGVAIDFRAKVPGDDTGFNGARLVATNGHILGLLHDTQALRGEVYSELPIIAADVIKTGYKAALKNKPKYNTKGGMFFCVRGADMLTATASIVWANSAADAFASGGDGVMTLWLGVGSCLVNGTFPDYSRVMPRREQIEEVASGYVRGEKTPATFTFNAKYAAPFYTIAVKGQYKGLERAVTFCHSNRDATGPLLVTVTDRPEFVGVLMPMRGGKSSDELDAAYAAIDGV